MKAVFYSVWILTKCIDTLFWGLILFSRSHKHFEMSDLTKIGFPKVISWTEQWNNGFWSIFIYGPRREETCLRLVFLTTQAQTSLRIRAVWSWTEQWILVIFYIWPRREKTCLRGFLQHSLISAFVVHYLESFICKLATGKISVFCSWGDWFETRFVRNPEGRFSHEEAQIIIVLLQYNIEKLLVTWPNLVGHHPFKTEYQHFLSCLSYEPYVDFHRSWRYPVWRRKRINIIRFRLPWPWGFCFQTHTSNFKFQILTKNVFRHSISQVFLGICCLIDWFET